MKDEILFAYRDEDWYVKHALTCDPDPKDFSFLSHYHNMYEIYYFLRGSGEFAIEGNIYTLKRGILLITTKGQAHNIRINNSEEPYERFVIMFGENQIPPGAEPVLKGLTEEKNCFMLEAGDADWLENCFETIEKAESHNMPVSRVAASVINLIFLKLCEYVQVGNLDVPVEDDIVRQIIRYINANLTEDWNLDTLENALYRNKAYLNRKFKSVMGCSIWEYVMRKRVFSAQQELYLSKSVTTAFETSGFNDYSAFYRKYVKYVGCSPSEDLKRHLG